MKTLIQVTDRRKKGIALALLTAGLFFAAAADQRQAPPPETSKNPAALGFLPQRLARLHSAMQLKVDQHLLAGLVTILARHGQIVEERAYGKKDLASGAPMTTDSLFRIFSMTKPVTGVAMMILYEEGKWHPADPISQYIPEFAHLKVFKGEDASGKLILEDPTHPPTMGELMTHTAGFTYGLFGNTPVDQMYRDQHMMQSQSPQDMIDKLAKTPLLYQPGTRWVYSVSTDIQGYLVQKLSGEALPDFMQQHIFSPLRMKDTGFFVPKDKRDRFATLYGEDEHGQLVPRAAEGNSPATNYSSMPATPSGGGGLVSTAQDYLRFSQMLLNGGILDGERILSPSSVRLMTSNHLAPALMTGQFFVGPWVMRPGMGFGYDCAVFSDPLQADEIVGNGTYFWTGSAGTWFWIDPTNDLIFIGMTQRLYGPTNPVMERYSRPTVYQALVDPAR